MTIQRHICLLRGAAVLLLCLSSGCIARPEVKSQWVPADFEVDVREYRFDAEQVPTVARQFLVWADGLTVYREAETAVRDERGDVPLFTRICIYRMQESSVRMYGRLLQRAGLFRIEGVDPEDRAPQPGDVALRWTAFGDAGELGRWAGESVVFDRMMGVTAAFMPEGFGFGGEDGGMEPRHVSEAPQPVGSLDEAIAAHRELLSLRPEDAELARELRALESQVGAALAPR